MHASRHAAMQLAFLWVQAGTGVDLSMLNKLGSLRHANKHIMEVVCHDWMCQSPEVTLLQHVLVLRAVENFITSYVCHVPFQMLGDWNMLDCIAFTF